MTDILSYVLKFTSKAPPLTVCNDKRLHSLSLSVLEAPGSAFYTKPIYFQQNNPYLRLILQLQIHLCSLLIKSKHEHIARDKFNSNFSNLYASLTTQMKKEKKKRKKTLLILKSYLQSIHGSNTKVVGTLQFYQLFYVE